MTPKVKTFFKVLRNSLFPNSYYYQKITKTRFNFSLKYFLAFVISLNLIYFIYLFYKYSPNKTIRFLTRIINQLNSYPKDLVIINDRQEVITSLTRPYFFWGGYENIRLWLVINESSQPQDILKFNSYVLITKNSLTIKPNFIKKNYYTFPLPQQNIKFDYSTASKLKNIFLGLKNNVYLYYIILTLPFYIIFNLASISIIFFYLLIISFITYLFFHYFFKKRIHFRKVLQISFHASTFPLIIDYLFVISPPRFFVNLPLKFSISLPTAFLILLTIFVFGAVYEAYISNNE